MELTAKQEAGLQIALNRYDHGERYTVIGGYAGAGKTTLVRYIIAALTERGIDPEEDVCFATFTGKASQVLLKKGNKNVSTLHKLLYHSVPNGMGGFIHRPVTNIDYKVVVVDEVSMAPKTLMDLLFSFKVHVICLGDPFQLPPIEKKEDNHLLDKPHIFLDEILRQAQESEIIRASMAVRLGKPLEPFGNEVKIYPINEISAGMMTWADQILCCTNNTRNRYNATMRELLGHSGGPETGDKVICLRNYWDILSSKHDPLINGSIGYLQDPFHTFQQIPSYVSWWNGGNIAVTQGRVNLEEEGNYFTDLRMDEHMILTGEKCMTSKEAYQISRYRQLANAVPLEFAYGYVITVWKAQGSEWDNVLFIEENYPYQNHDRCVYTAITRAADKLVWVR